jgi:hypothetical protein
LVDSQTGVDAGAQHHDFDAKAVFDDARRRIGECDGACAKVLLAAINPAVPTISACIRFSSITNRLFLL